MKRHKAASSQSASQRPRLAGVLLAGSLAACGGSGDSDPATPPVEAKALTCDDSMKAAFKPDEKTQVLFVKAFKKDDPLSLSANPATTVPKATADICLVKLLVGPGHPGPSGAPSTTAGIGMEAWLPLAADWNGRIRAEIPGAVMGGASITSTTALGSVALAQYAAANKIATVTTDGGHADSTEGFYLTNPDGTPNSTGWAELSHLAVHETALKMKALANAYYLKPASKSYASGCSSGGRAVVKSAQMYPGDFDGILAQEISIDQTQLFPSLVYGHVVQQRDLVAKGAALLTRDQRDAVSLAAVRACDTSLNGQHDGFVTNYEQCSYDPTKDAAVLCTGDGGTNSTAACVTRDQALVFNKMWYGVTADGSAPDPLVDNGASNIRSPDQIWWGRVRGTSLQTIANTTAAGEAAPLGVVLDQMAWNMQDLSLTRTNYVNASGTGADRWKSLSYAQFANVFYQGKLMNETVFADIDSMSPDLTKFRSAGGKMLHVHGIADPNVAVQTSTNFYTRSAAVAGGFAQAQEYHRLFLVPGRGHCGGAGTVAPVGSTPGGGNPPLLAQDQMLNALYEWVEAARAPDTLLATSADSVRTRNLCMYPRKQKYVGGDVNAAASYTCG